MTKISKILPNLYEIGLSVLVVTAFLSLKFLFSVIMGTGNEADILPLAKQYADPNWIPGDWYLNQPASYRLLFETLFGRLIVVWGFLATAVVGRLISYVLIALGLVLIGRKLGLNLTLILLAVGLFLYTNRYQGVAASESIVGKLEPKSFAYGLVLLAIRLMLEGRYRPMALLLGLATSFHVLVGCWTFLIVLGWLALRWNRVHGIRNFALIILLYLAGSAFAIQPVLGQLFTKLPPSPVTPSYVYVFLRLPHHLNPLSWHSDWWIKPTVYLLILAFSVTLIWQKRQTDKLSEQYIARIELVEFTLLSLVPFILGLAIAPIDTEGSFLQYYPFRLGDVMLTINTCLLLACALERAFRDRGKKVLIIVCIVLLSGRCSIQAVTFQKQFLGLYKFPKLDPEYKALCNWVRTYTPTNATVVSPPVDMVDFTWLSERPTIAKLKLLPQAKAGIVEWYQRLSDLSGDLSPWPTKDRTKDSRREIGRSLTNGYNQLTTAQADALMTKYQASYFVTGVEHQLDLPSAYSNSRFVLYSKKT